MVSTINPSVHISYCIQDIESGPLPLCYHPFYAQPRFLFSTLN